MTTRPDKPESRPDHARDEYRALFEHMSDVVFFVRVRDGRILQVNPAAESLYGVARERLIGARIYDLIATADGTPPAPPDATRYNQITAEGTLFESVHRRADGSEIPVEVNARVIEAAAEPYIIAVIRDVSERAESQAALRRAYVEMEQIFETAADGMRVVDRDFTVIRANRTLVEMTGLASEDVIGVKCNETFSGADCGTSRCPLVRAREGVERLADEVEKVRPDGTVIACLRTVVPFIVDGEFVGIIESFRDITERKQAERRAEHHATHDSLTGLPNRLLLGDRLESALARARREGVIPAVLFCDVDGFKKINDTLGHARGDEILSLVANVLASSVRASDTVARLGGDEFVVLLADAGAPSAAVTVAEKILAALQAYRTTTEGIHGAMASIGIAHFRDGDDADSLLGRADSAMYRVKARGGGGYLVAGTHRG